MIECDEPTPLKPDFFKLLGLPLPCGWIRLLKPVRDGGSDESCSGLDLKFELVTMKLPECPSRLYTAVSYAWGNGKALRTITVDGRQVPVRGNLWSCLYHLTQYWKQEKPSPMWRQWDHIWVDALCINQADDREKEAQIRQMDKIFARATEVSAWLGQHRDPGSMHWREDTGKISSSWAWDLDDRLHDVIHRPYWNRMWIVQELMLAEDVRFHIGDVSFTLEYLGRVLSRRRALKKATAFNRVMAHVRGRKELLDWGPSLGKWLVDFGHCKCQDPRDKVFALLGLLRDPERMVLSKLLPDYTLTHEAVVVIVLSTLILWRRLPDGEQERAALMDALEVDKSRAFRGWLLNAARKCSPLDHWMRDRQVTVVPQGYFPEHLDEATEKRPRSWRTGISLVVTVALIAKLWPRCRRWLHMLDWSWRLPGGRGTAGLVLAVWHFFKALIDRLIRRRRVMDG